MVLATAIALVLFIASISYIAWHYLSQLDDLTR